MNIITNPLRVLLFVVLLLTLLYFSHEVLVPVCFGVLLAMLFVPVCKWMEAKGIPRGFAAVLCVLILGLLVAGMLLLLAWQLSDLSKDLQGIEEKIKGFIGKVQSSVSDMFGVPEEQQKKMLEKQQSSGSEKLAGMAGAIMGSLMSLMVNAVLVVVYIFLFLFLRSHIKKFVLMIVPAGEKQKASSVMKKSGDVAQGYLGGLAMMIALLWVLYSIGFSIVGVKNPIFFAVLCGTLEIVPFIGNIAGTILTIVFSLARGGDANMLLGILVVYAAVQFVQSYIIEPWVVGSRVNINPLSTVLALVAGEALWGIAGLVLAIPLLGIVKIIFDNVEQLKPYGFLIGEEKKKSGNTNFFKKIKNMFGKHA